jgi:hypothetical protein
MINDCSIPSEYGTSAFSLHAVLAVLLATEYLTYPYSLFQLCSITPVFNYHYCRYYGKEIGSFFYPFSLHKEHSSSLKKYVTDELQRDNPNTQKYVMKQLWHSKRYHIHDLLKTALKPRVCITDDIHLSKHLFLLFVPASCSDICAWNGMDTTFVLQFQGQVFYSHVKLNLKNSASTKWQCITKFPLVTESYNPHNHSYYCEMSKLSCPSHIT